MTKLLQVDFEFQGPFGETMSKAMTELADSINHEPGMIWKLWTENTHTGEAGGVYMFQDQASAEDYLAMHSARLQAMGIKEVRGKIFDINTALSAINNGPAS